MRIVLYTITNNRESLATSSSVHIICKFNNSLLKISPTRISIWYVGSGAHYKDNILIDHLKHSTVRLALYDHTRMLHVEATTAQYVKTT